MLRVKFLGGSFNVRGVHTSVDFHIKSLKDILVGVRRAPLETLTRFYALIKTGMYLPFWGAWGIS